MEFRKPPYWGKRRGALSSYLRDFTASRSHLVSPPVVEFIRYIFANIVQYHIPHQNNNDHICLNLKDSKNWQVIALYCFGGQ